MLNLTKLAKIAVLTSFIAVISPKIQAQDAPAPQKSWFARSTGWALKQLDNRFVGTLTVKCIIPTVVATLAIADFGVSTCAQGCQKVAQTASWLKGCCVGVSKSDPAPENPATIATMANPIGSTSANEFETPLAQQTNPETSSDLDQPVLTDANSPASITTPVPTSMTEITPASPATSNAELKHPKTDHTPAVKVTKPENFPTAAASQFKQALKALRKTYYQPDLTAITTQISEIKILITSTNLYLAFQPAAFYTDFKFPAKELLALGEYRLIGQYLAIASTKSGVIGISAADQALLIQILAAQIKTHENALADLTLCAKQPESQQPDDQADLQMAIKQHQKMINQQCRLWCQLANAGATAFTGEFLYQALKAQNLSAIKFSFTHEGHTGMLYAHALVWLERWQEENSDFRCQAEILRYFIKMVPPAKAQIAIDRLNLNKAHRQRLSALDQYYRATVTDELPTSPASELIRAATPARTSTPDTKSADTGKLETNRASSPDTANTSNSPELASPSLQSISNSERHSPTEFTLDRSSLAPAEGADPATISPVTELEHTSITPAPVKQLKTAAETAAIVQAAVAQLQTQTKLQYYDLAQVKVITQADARTKDGKPAKHFAMPGAEYKIGKVTYSC